VERRSIFVQVSGLRQLRSPNDLRNAPRRIGVPAMQVAARAG
jgi:hypothetical protein